MHIIRGTKRAEEILGTLRDEIRGAKKAPVFAAVLVGDDAASHVYVHLKEKAAISVGIIFQKVLLPQSTSQEELLLHIQRLNEDATVCGILVQLPLPSHIQTQVIIDAVDAAKDVDGFHPENIQKFLQKEECIAPVFPRAIMELIRSVELPLKNKQAVVIGNSAIFGQMMLSALQDENIEGIFIPRTSLASKYERVLAADIIVTAVGEAHLLTGNMVKDGAIVIDGGIVKILDTVTGDVDRLSMEQKKGWLSPVPGGVGPVTIACLLSNVWNAFLNQNDTSSQNRE